MYVGWGGLADCFDEKHSRYQELKSLLTEEEFTQARASTLNAHYTSPSVIKAMYKALENMGFKQGNILEPSCGIGNFMGLLPDSMNESKMYGIEIDSLTGRIAQRLYPNNSVTIQGYENATLPDSFFDVAIGNVPFGNYKLPDKKYDKHNFFIHDYFFAKTLDKVRPGGVVAFITSMGTMDKKNSAVRKYIAQRADLIGAIRLPNDAFYKNAGTSVTADILFLQKRDRQTDIMPDWVNLGTLENGLTVNQYFVDNPDMILGEMTEESSQYGKSLTCKPYEDADLAEQLEDAIQSVHAQITEYEFDDISDDEDLTIPADPDVKNFSYTLVDGEIYFRENSIMKKVELMVAAAMESKRLGLCNKSLFVVPNHLTEQWASEFLQLYPAANILVATKKDFETKNRKKFCGRIATGDYDAVIIGHSQFEKIPMSVERQVTILQREINEIMMGIAEAKASRAENFTIKQMEKARRNLEAKLAKLNDQSRKDDVVTFEELGVDRVFVDEAHYYKNLFLYTKMRNVGGISQTEAQKSSDMYMKSRYLDELTGGKGLIFATGTPVSNSMVELYTMQRYLQYGALAERDLQHFDAWASTYGETVTAIELAPEGTGYRAKTRFAKFFNLPELMNIFKEVADIQTADTLNLPVPEAIYHNVATERTEIQKEFVENCGERAEKVREGNVDPHIDNMLKITNDGRKIALDQRLENDLLPDDETSKVNECFRNVYKIWDENRDEKLTQIVFCDMSTPKPDGTFDVYNDIKEKLIQQGVPESEIAFIHDAETEARKKELFAKVRKGDVRILFAYSKADAVKL